jgi:hypothetical protein
MIACGRPVFRLAPNDYKVLFAGIPFMIVDNGPGHPKLSGTLYIKEGQFKFDTEKGEQPTPDQFADIQRRLGAFQKIQQGDK